MKHILTIALASFFLTSQAAMAQPMPSDQDGRHHGREQFHKSSKGRHSKKNNTFKEKIREFHEQQKEKRRTFKGSLKETDPAEKHRTMQEFSQQQYQERTAFHKKMHEERLAKLKERLNSKENLGDEEKQKIISEAEARYQERKTARKERYEETQKYIQSIWDDESLTPEEKCAEVQEHMKKQKKERKETRQEHRENFKEQRREFKQNRKERSRK